MTALIVDDDPILRSLLRAKLVHQIPEAYEADDGGAAWDLLRNIDFQIAFVDLEMPNIDGITLIQCIRAHPRTRHLPIVVITGRQDAGALKQALDAGATSYLQKPLNWSTFEHHVGHLLALSDLSAKLERFTDACSEVLGTQEDSAAKLNADALQALDALSGSIEVDGSNAMTAEAVAVIKRALVHQAESLSKLEDVVRAQDNAVTVAPSGRNAA